MHLELTEEQSAIQDMARRFTADEITPFAAQWDEEHTFPRDALNKAAELGFGPHDDSDDEDMLDGDPRC